MQKKTEKKPVKKLTLSRETIRALSQSTQARPGGGTVFSPCRKCLTTI